MADEQHPKSIGDSIREAFDAVEPEEDAPARPAPRPAPAPEKERDELDEGIEELPPRDDKGRFVPRETLLAPEPEEKKQSEPEPRVVEHSPEPEPEPVQEPPSETREQRLAKLTKNWRPEDREFLGKQPEEVQDFLVRRQSEMDAAYTRKTQEIAYLKNEYGPVHEMLAPDLPAIRAAGYTPRLLIEGWASAERALLSGPQSAAATLRNIAEGYKIPRELVAATFGFDPRTPEQLAQVLRQSAPIPSSPDAAWAAAQPPAPQAPAPTGNGLAVPEYRDPRVDQLIAQEEERRQQAVLQYNQRLRNAAGQAQAQIQEFRDATDAKGNLLHPYFAEVEGHMTALAKFHGENTGRIPPLQELYESAVNANPATRAKLRADAQRVQSERQRQAEAARGKTEQARRAASSVVGQGSGRPNNRTLEKPLPKGAGIRASIDAAFNEVAGDQE